jgi:hypothetical protein
MSANPLAILGGIAAVSLPIALTAPTLLRLYCRILTWPVRQVREFIYGYRHHEEVFRELAMLRQARLSDPKACRRRPSAEPS